MLNALQQVARSTSGMPFPAKRARLENRSEAPNVKHQDITTQAAKNENALEVHKVSAQQVDCQFETIVSQDKIVSPRTVELPIDTELSDWPTLLQSTIDEATLTDVISGSEPVVHAVADQPHPAEHVNSSKLSGQVTPLRSIDAVPNHAKGTGKMGDPGLVEVRLENGANGPLGPASNDALTTSSHAELDEVLEEMDLSSFARRESADFNMGQLLAAVPEGITQESRPPGTESDAVNLRHVVDSPRAECRSRTFDAGRTGAQPETEISFSLQQGNQQHPVGNGGEIPLAGELLDLVSFLPDQDVALFETPDLEGVDIPLEVQEVRQPVLHDQAAFEDHQVPAPDIPEPTLSAVESPPREKQSREPVVDVCPENQAPVSPFESIPLSGEGPVAHEPLFKGVVENMEAGNDKQQFNIEEEDATELNMGKAFSANTSFEEAEVAVNQTTETNWTCSPEASVNGGTCESERKPVAKPEGMQDAPRVQQELSGAVPYLESRENHGLTASTEVQETESPLPALKDAVAELLRFSIPLLSPASLGPTVHPAAQHLEERRLAELSGTQVGRRYRELADYLYGSLPFKSASSISFLGIESTADTTEVVTNAGLLLAQEPSERVLLIDGDFSDKRLTRQFLLHGSKGLAEVLNDERTCGDVVRPCETPNLSVLPAGTGLFPRQPSAVRRLPSIIDELKQQFSIILFDAGGAEDSEVETLVRWTDASYLVLPLGAHTVEDLDGVISLLQRCAARTMGCILTNVTVETVS
jgi:Mrp family chromosome partitioning ATPase